ncbi:NADPH-dependent F420 reductase [Nannocystis pusilla]|uniref:NADPH-dependent F420 reductase n=1 Tax=Nannocystis pusilla TaxID=889268 RepID=A0ABS7TZ84_9BACT|nr:NADPH-dependent F420 reductase [Nannocystis pusilla]MBZ5713592.1 NADPH-dependent F420 reductase [Nannocystis pusilla]
MTIGIIGTGAIGQALIKHLVRAGHRVLLSNSRGPESLADLARALGPGARAVTVREAATADIVFLAVPWKHLPAALKGLPAWDGRIVVDPTNPLGPPDFRVADLGGRTSSEVVADMVPGARVVKAFNTLPPPVLGADPRQGGGRRVIFMSGDDQAAKAKVRDLIDGLGFAPVDLGSLAEGGKLQQFPGGPLPTLDLLKL